MLEFIPRRRRLLIVIAVIAVITLSAIAPSYNYVRVTGGGNDVEVHRAGFGPQRVRVQTGDAVIESSSNVLP